MADEAKRQAECNFRFEKCGQLWRLTNDQYYYCDSNLSSSILFPNLKRFSLVTIPQAINRLLQTISSANDTLLKNNATMGGRRKKFDISSNFLFFYNVPLTFNQDLFDCKKAN
ncbi:hypothetical protein WUBG_18718 [Wuchereria bancrofti]|uniref:Uncharacterized protein n=1 Tax=Wuchereria bancrofti TaxID=6293 RepID=J9E0D8_WUCBA|nr:hypothetical protein WUBG_18718 [Wuchereria bancrofti]